MSRKRGNIPGILVELDQPKSNRENFYRVKKKCKEASAIEYINEIFVLYIRFVHGERMITCWLPLKNNEAPNKKTKTCDQLKMRKKQMGRGGYYQVNGGKSVHVYFLESSLNIKLESNDSQWSLHVSHRCHHWWCCNPEHLVQEPDWVNLMRKKCILSDKKECNCDYAFHPAFNHTLKKCIWYTPATITKLGKKCLDESFLINMSEADKKRFENWEGTFKSIKDL